MYSNSISPKNSVGVSSDGISPSFHDGSICAFPIVHTSVISMPSDRATSDSSLAHMLSVGFFSVTVAVYSPAFFPLTSPVIVISDDMKSLRAFVISISVPLYLSSSFTVGLLSTLGAIFHTIVLLSAVPSSHTVLAESLSAITSEYSPALIPLSPDTISIYIASKPSRVTVCSLPLYSSVPLAVGRDTFLAVMFHTIFLLSVAPSSHTVFAGSLSAISSVYSPTLVPLSPDTTVMSVPSKPSGTKVCSSPLYSSVPPVGTATILLVITNVIVTGDVSGLGASSGAHAESDPLLKPTLTTYSPNSVPNISPLITCILSSTNQSPNSKLITSPVYS